MSKRIRTRIPKTETITARKSKTQRDYPALRFIRFGLWDGSDLVLYDDANSSSSAEDWFYALEKQDPPETLYVWQAYFAAADDLDTPIGQGSVFKGDKIGTVTYMQTVDSLIAGFASILSANGLTPIPPEVVWIVDLLADEKGTSEYDAAVAKIAAIAAGDSPLVDPQTLYAWVGSRQLGSCDLAFSDYVAASVNLGTRWPITGGAEVTFADVEESSADGFSFKIELKLDGEESPEELTLVKEFVAGCIRTTGDLSTGFGGKTVGTDRVKIDSATGKVTIEPDKADPTKAAELFKIVLPKDPGAK